MSKRANLGYARWLSRLAAWRRRAGALLQLAVLDVGLTPPVRAADTQTDFLPELNAYIKLADTTRLFLLGSRPGAEVLLLTKILPPRFPPP